MLQRKFGTTRHFEIYTVFAITARRRYLLNFHVITVARRSVRLSGSRPATTASLRRTGNGRSASASPRNTPIWHENEKEDAPVRTNGGHRPLFTQIKMAALRLFARTRLSTLIPYYPGEDRLSSGISPVIDQIQKRWGTYMSSPKYTDPSKYTDYEVTKDPKEWEYVERILKPKVIPAPCLENKEYPSGWKPPVAKPHAYPYYIPRTKNYMQPVYLEICHRGLRRVTTVRKIHGDIWTLESELKEYIEKRVDKPIGIRTNELLGEIKFRGDYVNLVKAWMDERGF